MEINGSILMRIGLRDCYLSNLGSLTIRKCDNLCEISFYFPNLRTFTLDRCGVNKLKIEAPSLEVIRISECHDLSDVVLIKELKKCKKLRNIFVSNCKRIFTDNLKQALSPASVEEFATV